MIVKLTLLKHGHNKFNCVKTIKKGSSLGLIEAKHILDYAVIGQAQDVDVIDVDIFRENLLFDAPDYEWSVGDVVSDRKRKLIDLGIGDNSDRIDMFSKYLSLKIYSEIRVSDGDVELMDIIKTNIFNIFDGLEDDELVEKLYNNIYKNFNYGGTNT